MLITIESIDESSMQPIGCMKIPGFIVRFTSPAVSGFARFVPSSGTAKGCIDQSFYVEINQENTTDVQLLPLKAIESITPLPAPGSFLVLGTVTALVPLGGLDGQLVTVAARDATFTLESKELGDIQPMLGEQITFVAHDLSLWDEAI
jgi:hypothetical protein